MNHKEKCMEDNDIKLVLKNADKIKILHQKKGIKLINWSSSTRQIIVPVTINVCVNSKKYKIDFIKYSKHMVDILNNGFSGKSHSPYKNTHSDDNFMFNVEYIKNILETNKNTNCEKNANIIYDFINKKIDTNIRFFLHSIVFHDTFIEESYEKKDIETFLESINKKGFKILEKHYKHLNINIIKFNCSTLGVSTFPWMKYVSNKISGCMQVFLDFCTIHPDIATNQFNNCKTLIHEVGHIFGLRHTFSCNKETLQVYSILLGKIIDQREILNNINLTNTKDLHNLEKQNKNKNNKHNVQEKDIVNEIIDKHDLIFVKDKLSHSKINVQLYSDVPSQIVSTNYNPFEINKFPFYNNVPTDFACFMDYSPDDVLTHFTESQKIIMHYMIRMFKPYLIKKTSSEVENLNNCKVKLYINTESKIKNDFLLSILATDLSEKYYVNYDSKNSFKYSISNTDDKFNKLIYKEK
jgi:hypothetical protein